MRKSFLALSFLLGTAVMFPAEAAVTPAAPSVDGFLTFLSAAEGASQSMILPGAEVIYTSSSCTITQKCGWSPSISCTGTTCSSAEVHCGASPTTCPLQPSPLVAGVRCSTGGVTVVESCPCPDICYGCDAPCQNYEDCEAVCTCGAVDCEDSKCHCGY